MELPEATSVAFSTDPECSHLLVGDQFGICRLYDVQSGKLLVEFRHPGRRGKLNAVAFLPDTGASNPVTASTDGRVIIWSYPGEGGPPEPHIVLAHDQRAVTAIDISNDGSLLATACFDLSARRDGGNGRGPTDGVAKNAELRVYALSSIDIANPQPVIRHELKPNELVRSIDFGPTSEGPLLITTTELAETGSSSNAVFEWEWKTDSVRHLAERREISMARYQPKSGRVLFVGGKAAQLVSLQNQGSKSFSGQPGMNGVAISADSQFIATAGKDGSIKIWQLEGDEWISGPKIDGAHEKEVTSLAFRPAANQAGVPQMLVSSGASGDVKAWSVSRDQVEPRFEIRSEGPAHADRVNHLVFSSTGDAILTCSNNGKSKLWLIDAEGTTAAFQTEFDCGGAARSAELVELPQGDLFAAIAVDRAVKFWKLGDPNWKVVTTPIRHSSSITSLAFTPDGKRMFTASEDFTVRVWDTSGTFGLSIQSLDAGEPQQEVELAANLQQEDEIAAEANTPRPSTPPEFLMTLEGHRRAVTAICLVPEHINYIGPNQDVDIDGAYLLSAGRDGQTILWPSKPPQ